MSTAKKKHRLARARRAKVAARAAHFARVCRVESGRTVMLAFSGALAAFAKSDLGRAWPSRFIDPDLGALFPSRMQITVNGMAELPPLECVSVSRVSFVFCDESGFEKLKGVGA